MRSFQGALRVPCDFSTYSRSISLLIQNEFKDIVEDIILLQLTGKENKNERVDPRHEPPELKALKGEHPLLLHAISKRWKTLQRTRYLNSSV
jgi:hypothetical protein